MRLTVCGASQRSAAFASLPAALLAVVCLPGCGLSARSLHTAKIERAIAASILKQRNLDATVACPSRIPQQAGHSFTCTASFEVGTYPVAVTEIGGEGQVRYSNPRPLIVLNIAKVERAIEASVSRQRHVTANVSCPAEVLQRAGLAFRCTAVVKAGARRFSFAVSEVDDAGHVRYVGT
jgi:hypothetical protein